MTVERRAPRLLVIALAVPVIAVAYAAFAVGRAICGTRALAAALLGATVIGAVYVDEAWRRTPTPARRASLPTMLAVALALAIGATGLPAAQVQAHDPAENVVQAALEYLGKPYVWGAEGPKAFDCSGLVYRAFRDAGELPLIGGTRTTAARYLRWFSTRGLTDTAKGRRGDLVVYRDGKHIGIYLGKGRVISAVDDRVQIHALHGLRGEFTTFLTVPWGGLASADPDVGGAGGTRGDRGGGSDDQDSDSDADADADAVTDSGSGRDGDKKHDRDASELPIGHAFGSLNMRAAPDPKERIISWVTRGSTFTILETGRSPSGALWLRVEKKNGRQGWIWARWTRVIEGSLDDLNG